MVLKPYNHYRYKRKNRTTLHEKGLKETGRKERKRPANPYTSGGRFLWRQGARSHAKKGGDLQQKGGYKWRKHLLE